MHVEDEPPAVGAPGGAQREEVVETVEVEVEGAAPPDRQDVGGDPGPGEPAATAGRDPQRAYPGVVPGRPAVPGDHGGACAGAGERPREGVGPSRPFAAREVEVVASRRRATEPGADVDVTAEGRILLGGSRSCAAGGGRGR